MTTENKNSQSQDDHAELDQEQYDILKRCSEKKNITEWNSYRVENPKTRIHLKNADLEGATIFGANLTRADLTGANLKGGALYGVDLTRADLMGANLEEAKLKGADLTGANLEEANLTGADLEGAKLERADLTRANLFGAILFCANLEGATLFRANLEKAYLEGAKLFGTDLTGADLLGAELEGADLEGAIYGKATDDKLIESTEQDELVINLANDITYEEVTKLLRALNGLHSSLVGFAPYLNEIQIGQHTDEYTAAQRED